MHALAELERFEVDNPQRWMDEFGPEHILDGCAWLERRRKRGPAGVGVLLLELRSGRLLGYRARHAPPPQPTVEPCSLTEELDQAWGPVAVELRQLVGQSAFEIWLAPLHPHDFTEGWVLACPPATVRWVERRFGRVLERVCGEPVRIVPCSKEREQ